MYDSFLGALILAAGRGTRMESQLPKPLVPLAGKPIIYYIIEVLQQVGVNHIAIVVGHGADEIKGALGNRFTYVMQKKQKGTAHAVLVASSLIAKYKDVLVFVGDSPLIRHDTIQLLIDHHYQSLADCTFLTGDFPRPFPYARVVRDTSGNVIKCVEEQWASPEEKRLNEYMTSHYIFNTNVLIDYVKKIKPDPETNEFYLTDIIGALLNENLKVDAVKVKDYRELVGLNTPDDLAWAEGIARGRYV